MPRPPRRSPRALPTVLAAAMVVAACSSGDGAASGCRPITREALDAAYLVHVVGDAPPHDYTSDPPTSGPHQAGPALAGVVEVPIGRAAQVGILERGDILLQHDPALGSVPLRELRALAGPGVVVAPNPDLPASIVATAWVHKRLCSSFDSDALEEFIELRSGQGPDS